MMGEVRPDVMTLMGKSAGWLRFLSILSFLFGAFTLLMAVAFGPMLRTLIPVLGGLGFALSALLIGFAVVYVVCGLRMWAYASAIRRLQAGRMVQDFEVAMERQAALWVTVAAMTGVTILIMAGFFVYVIATVTSFIESAL